MKQAAQTSGAGQRLLQLVYIQAQKKIGQERRLAGAQKDADISADHEGTPAAGTGPGAVQRACGQAAPLLGKAVVDGRVVLGDKTRDGASVGGRQRRMDGRGTTVVVPTDAAGGLLGLFLGHC